MPLISTLGAASSRGFGEFTRQEEPVYVEDVFGTFLYSGNSSSGGSQTITNNINLSGKGGLVWIKARNQNANHMLTDTVRGAGTSPGSSNALSTNLTSVEGLGLSYCDYVSAFSTTGFTVTQSGGGGLATTAEKATNTSGFNYAAFTFREQSKFFDIVTYTGNGSARTISHNLGSVPGMIIVKARSEAGNWVCYHRSVGNASAWDLNAAAGSYSSTAWNSTTPTSSVFSIGANNTVNRNGITYVAYLFAHNAGGFGLTGTDSVVSCGSFVPGSTAVSVNLGWEPQFVLFQNITAPGGSPLLFDNMRGLYAASATFSNRFNIDSNGTESNSFNYITVNATGFVINPGITTGATYMYLAIRRGPMKTPTDATTVFSPVIYTGTNTTDRVISTTVRPDVSLWASRTRTVYLNNIIFDRLRGVFDSAASGSGLGGGLATNLTSAESPNSAFQIVSLDNTSLSFGSSSNNGFNNNTVSGVLWNLTRAPSFMDVACYAGTGSAGTVSHSLGVVPEMIIVKGRNGATDWPVYHTGTNGGVSPQQYYTRVNSTAAETNAVANWNNTAPTSTVFSIGGNNVGAGTNYVAYLFASCPGVSKVGSYTGTGATQTISCGFTAGARFVLIKRTDSTGDWYVYDTARGIIAGNDPYVLLNSTAAEVTSTDYVDAYSAGFELSSTAPAGLNAAFGSTWTAQTSGFGTTAIYEVTYGNNLFVAVGNTGNMTTSVDGVSWTARTSGFGTSGIYGVTYGNGLYVAVGDSGKLTTSPDGVTWTARTSGFGTDLIYNVTYGNGLFVAVGNNGKIATSSNGTTWTLQTSVFGTSLINDVAYGNGVFVAVSTNGQLATSPDGVTWTSRTSGFGTSAIEGVTYGNGLFVAVGHAGKIGTSSDGITWTQQTSGVGSAVLYDVTYGGGFFVAVGAGGTMTTSPDATTWTTKTSGFGTTAINAVTYGNGLFVAVGNTGTMTTTTIPTYIYLAIA